MSVVDGVSEVHRNNFIHRDLKPDNIVSHYPDESQEFGLYKISGERGKGVNMTSTSTTRSSSSHSTSMPSSKTSSHS